MKECNRCFTEKEEKEFYIKAVNNDGLHCMCKVCYKKEYYNTKKRSDGLKLCKVCGEDKPESEFYKHRLICKNCLNDARRKK